jgi:hypothetical protein
MPDCRSRLHLCVFICVLFAATLVAHAQEAMRLPDAKAGASYAADIRVEGGLPPLTWKLTSGEIPWGLRVTDAGRIEGVPKSTRREPYSFEVTVTDSSQPPQSAVQKLTISVAAAPLRITGVSSASQLRIVGVQASEGGEVVGKEAADSGGSQSPRGPSEAAGQAGVGAPSESKDQSQSKDQAAKVTCPNPSDRNNECGGPWLRTIVGFEQAGVSAAQSQQDFFFDVYYDRPLAFHDDKYLGPALRSWGNLRISSVPQQITTDVATFVGGFAQQVGKLKVNEVAQAFEFLGGLQYRLTTFGRRDYASTDTRVPDIHNRISLNFVLGGGVITPLSPKASVQLFSVPSNQPDFFTLYPQAVGKQFVAFTLADRDRFFRQAYGGFRVMTHFLGEPGMRAPETFDLTYGFNEAVTGGRIRGGVMRLEGFVPIPYDRLKWVYLFGTGLFKPGAKAANDERLRAVMPFAPNSDAFCLCASHASSAVWQSGFLMIRDLGLGTRGLR